MQVETSRTIRFLSVNHMGSFDTHNEIPLFRLGNGDCYEGEFKSNRFEGAGSYLSHDKQLYTGSWHQHRRHGHGEQTYVDGSRYSGNWVAGKRHGFGKLSATGNGSLLYEVLIWI